MRVALIQYVTDLAEPFEARVTRGCDMIREQRGADLIGLPELWATGYFAFGSYAATAQPLTGPACQALQQAARDVGCYVAAGSLVESPAAGGSPAAGADEGGPPEDGLYNTSLLLSPDGSLVHTYRKFHLFGYRSQEAALLRRGEALETYPARFGEVGLTTCYDLRFPELYRVLVAGGAQILVIVAAWPIARIEHWRLLLRARAVENQCYVLACNAAGTQEGTELGGHSAVIDPWGTVLAEGGTGADVITAEIDPAAVARVRAEFPFLAERRLKIEV